MEPEIILGFDLSLSRVHLKSAALVSLLSVLVLIGLFAFLNNYTRRRYFTIWNTAWLFYAVWLTLELALPGDGLLPVADMAKQWCIGTAAVFLLWGSARFLNETARESQLALFLIFLLVWSYIGAYHLRDPFWMRFPTFLGLGLASGLTAWCFIRFGRRRRYLGAGLLAWGFGLWGLHLAATPFLHLSPELVSAGFFIGTVVQLFIAVSMIILVLEEVRRNHQMVVRQVQDQKHKTDALRSQCKSTEDRYRSLFDQASEGIVIAEADNLRILELNRTAERHLGIKSFLPEKAPTLCQFLDIPGQRARPASGEEWFECILRHRRLNLVRRDGASTPAEMDGARISFNGTAAFQFFFRELTERARLEQQLRQSEKLSALGQMMSGIAHELNNPLTVIRGYLEIILKEHSVDPRTREDLTKAFDESQRCTKLVGNFLAFARPQPAQRSPQNLNTLILRILALRDFDLRGGGIETEIELAEDLPEIQLDADQIQQILINLINNAIQALGEVPLPRMLRVSSRLTRDHIEIKISDNGPGIPPDLGSRVFEPFFTTKEVGTGTGLGLSIAHTIMADHQGRILHEPEPGGGAAFYLHFPPDLAPASAPSSPMQALEPAAGGDPAPPAPAGPGRILILDDEPSITELLGEMLELLGHQTTLCGRAEEALRKIQEQDFDVVLSDFRMPVMNGQQFYEAARKLRPNLAPRIVFLTGDVVNEETQSFLASTGNPHLGKPFHLAQVETILNRLLATPTTP